MSIETAPRWRRARRAAGTRIEDVPLSLETGLPLSAVAWCGTRTFGNHGVTFQANVLVSHTADGAGASHVELSRKLAAKG